MKKLLLLPLLFVLTACEEDVPEPLRVAYEQTVEQVESIRLPYAPYFKYWEKCEINGETYEQVTFLYTDIGLGYIVDNVITYRADLDITYCEGILIEIE
jgi:hypothetical protein